MVFCGMVVGKNEIARPRLACLRWRTIEVVHRAVVGVVPVGREERHGTASQQEASRFVLTQLAALSNVRSYY